jgi:hypothetical protein
MLVIPGIFNPVTEHIVKKILTEEAIAATMGEKEADPDFGSVLK